MNDNETFFLLFRSIHDVLKVEKLLKKTDAAFELVPVPRAISSECGVCIKVRKSPKDLLPAAGVPDVERCYIYDGTDYVLVEIER